MKSHEHERQNEAVTALRALPLLSSVSSGGRVARARKQQQQNSLSTSLEGASLVL